MTRLGRVSCSLGAALLLALPLRAQCPDGSPPPCNRGARPAAPARGSIAVLPFANRSADSSDAFLAEEIPEQITGRLSRIGQLRVLSATAVSAQWRRTPDALAAARALRVEWLVTGSLRRSGRQLSATVELVRTATAEQAWSAPFRRGDDDLAAIETQIAESVAVAVVGRLAPDQVAIIQRTATRNPEAYRLYLTGRSLAARRTRADIDAAARALTTAVQLDPGFAGAWARLSIARGLQTQYGAIGVGLSTDSLLVLERQGWTRALQLDSTSAEGWLAMGQYYSITNDFGESWRALERAARLDPLDADIEHALGYLMSIDVMVVPDEAEKHFRRALALNPDLRNSWRHLGLTFEARGRIAEGIALLDSALARGPFLVGYLDRGWLRYEAGDFAGARADQARADSLGSTPRSAATPVPVDARRALYAATLGDSAAALAALASTDEGVGLVIRTIVAMGLGRREEAIAGLELLRRTPDPDEPRCAPAIPCSPSLRTWRALHASLFTPILGDPRVQRLLAETRPRAAWLEAR